MKKLWSMIKKQKRTALLAAVVAGVLLASGVWYAIAATTAFDDYELTEDNEFYIYVDQAVRTSEDNKGGAFYSVNDGWHLFFEEDIERLRLTKTYADKVGENYLDNWEKSVFDEGISFPLESLGYDEAGPDEFGLTRETYRVDAGKLLDIIKKRYTGDDREKLKGSITVYFAPVITCEIYSMENGDKPADKGLAYSYSEFDKWAETNTYYNFYPWPGATLSAVSRMYGKPVTLSLAQTPFTVRFLNLDTGEEITGYSFPAAEEYQGFALYGETLKFSSGLQGEAEGYEYAGYYWNDDVSGIQSGRTPKKIKLTRDFLASGDLVLTFAFREVKLTNPPTKPPTEPPSAPPTNPPTPTPTVTPTPITVPADNIEKREIHYYTTDKGYYVGQAAVSSWNLATKDSVSGTKIGTNTVTVRDLAYTAGSDSGGNTWYFIPDGTSATYVHPYKYGSGITKYQVDSADVKNITELTFPSTIASGGITYTVTSIGGATNKYTDWNESSNSTSETVKTPSNSHYYYEKASSNSSAGTDIEVRLGVAGNGEYVSSGYTYTDATGEADYEDENYESSYYYYNTTLREITIPDTVTRIEDCAFINCQKLGNINGGEGLTYIGEHAFEGALHLGSVNSESWKNNDNVKCYKYYYYNESCCFDYEWTDTMLEWDVAVQLGTYFYLPEFPNLRTVSGYAFRRRADLYNVVLPECITSIGYHAFADCYLDSITVPGTSVTLQEKDTITYSEVYKTLGANEAEEKTIVFASVGSKAFSYARKYMNYYRLQSGHDIIYEPNGGAESAESYVSDIEFVAGGYKYADRCEGSFVVEADGTVWNLSKEVPAVLGSIEGGFECCEMKFQEIPKEDGGTFHAYWILRGQDKSRWVLEIENYADSGGTKSFRSMSLFEHTILTAALEVELMDETLYFLSTDGKVIQPYLWKDAAYKIVSGDMVFVDIYTCNAADKETLYGVSADGKVYDILNSLAEISTPEGVSVKKYLGSDSLTQYCVDTDGNLWACLTVERNTKQWRKLSPAEGFVLTGEVKAVFLDSGSTYSSVVLCDEDSAESVYIRYYSSTYTNEVSIKSSVSLPGGLKKMHSVTVYDDIDGDGEMSVSDIFTYDYLLGNDGSMYHVYGTALKIMAGGTKMKEVCISGESVLTLDINGHIWSTGDNSYGELGNRDTLGKDIKEQGHTVMKELTCVSLERRYTDIGLGADYAVALGEDGYLYGAGDSRYFGYDGYNDPKEGWLYEALPTFVKLVTHTGGIKLLEGCTFYFTGDGQIWIRDKEFTLIDHGYRFLHTVHSNFRSDGTFLFTRNGYLFTGWNTAADGSGTALGAGQVIELNGPTRLYAQWTEDNNRVVYKANGGSGYMADTEQAASVTSIYLKKNTYSRQGYKFVGWNTTADGSGTAYGDGQYIPYFKGTLTLYAQWSFAPVNYTLKFANEIPELFNGYLSAHSMVCTYTVDGMTTKGTAVEVPAEPFSKAYTVGYDTNKKDSMSTTPVLVTTPTDAHTRAVFVFDGWKLYRDNSGTFSYLGKKYAAGATVSDLTKVDGDTLIMFPEWGGLDSYVILPLAECKGYEFCGWAESAMEANKTNVIPVDTSGGAVSIYQPTKSGKLYAVWEPNTYEVTLDGRGATDTDHTTEVVMVFDEKGTDIKIPTKTGYAFRGYYSGIRGTGTRYYNETGNCVKTWTEDGKEILYAYWIPEDIETPESGERVEPTQLPEEKVEGIIEYRDANALLYADDYNPATGALDDLQPYLTYETPFSQGAIPGTEQVSFRARMGAWMLSYKFHRYSGTDYVRIYVTVPYRTQYERANEELVISEQQRATYAYEIPKTWSYWAVAESGLYYPDKVEVKNAAVQDGGFSVPVDRNGSEAVVVPDCEITEYGAKENHVLWKEYDTDGTPVLRITLTEEEYIISTVTDTPPDVESYLTIVCGNAAWGDTRQAEVRSDKYVFHGKTILSDALQADGNGAGLQEDMLLIETDVVECTSYKQTYKSGILLDERKPNGTYGTTAVITYISDASNVGVSSTKEVVIRDINVLKVHTPVACDGVAVSGIEDGVLVLKDALNFFTLRIDNTGTHRMILGYGTRDFSVALSGKSNIAEKNGNYLNQVQFPFDVYVDVGSDSQKADGACDTDGDYYLAAGNWLTMGDREVTFYVPVTQMDGSYQIKCRTIAVNCPQDTNGEYDLSGVTEEKVNLSLLNYVATDTIELEIKGFLRDFLITGTNDPVAKEKLQSGCQALTIKKGYEFSYRVLTQGAFYGNDSKIEITPKYFWISEDESERQEVTLYNISESGTEAKKTCYAWEAEPILSRYDNHSVILQQWNGTGQIPSDVLCVANGADLSLAEEYFALHTVSGRETFFKQSGYLVVHFEIKVKSDGNIWYPFEEWMTTKLAQDALAAGWNYVPGDIIRYDLSSNVAEDYEIGGVE